VTIRYLPSLLGVDDDALDTMMRAADTSPEAAETGGLGLRELATMPGSFAVIADVHGAPVGCSVAQQSNSSGWVLMTATLPSVRRRGIGRAVKEALHTYGYQRGVRRFGTRNESGNDAIRRLNQALGYTVVCGTFGVRQQF
jgi:ribosomal-protein-alanine N-acetyltransferase